MPCFKPMVASPMPGRLASGKSPIRFLGKASSWHGPPPVNGYVMPCKQCIGCRLEYSRQWATRLIHETKFWEHSIFLTLTYDDDHLPENRSLNPSHLATFFKDLNARFSYYGKGKFKRFAVGEYGYKDEFSKRQKQRDINPHYHAIVYSESIGITGDDPGRTEEEPSRSGDRQWSHVDFSAVWPYGRHRFSECSFESAAYVARYCLKKVSGVNKEAHYGVRVPEFSRPSKGLGKSHVEAWQGDIYPQDRVCLPDRGDFLPPPYYDRLLEKVDPGLFAKVKSARKEAHEKMTGSQWWEHVERRDREGRVKTLVVDKTLKREGVV